jgi:hypothetical protein
MLLAILQLEVRNGVLNKAFDLLKSDVQCQKIGLRPSKTWHYPSLSTQTGTKKEDNKA